MTHSLRGANQDRERARKTQVLRALGIGVPIGIATFYNAPLDIIVLVLVPILVVPFVAMWGLLHLPNPASSAVDVVRANSRPGPPLRPSEPSGYLRLYLSTDRCRT
jgi:hypothetical protein